MPQPAQLSIVIPAYNEANYLPECLASLALQQVRVPFEVIVVVTSDHDNSIPVVEAAKAKVPYTLRYIIETERGVCAARQAGCLAATGNVLVSTDADIRYPAGWLQRIIEAFQDEAVVGLAGPFVFQKHPRWAHYLFRGLFKLNYWYYKIYRAPLYVAGMNLAFTRAAFNQIGGYNRKLHQGGDELDVLRRLRKVGEVHYIHTHIVLASNRRFQRNIIYSFFVTFLYYYLLEYWGARLLKRSLVGPAPAIRTERYH